MTGDGGWGGGGGGGGGKGGGGWLRSFGERGRVTSLIGRFCKVVVNISQRKVNS